MSASLVNYLVPDTLVLVGVGWTLVIEVLFYVLLAAVQPLLRRLPAAVPLVLLVICVAAELGFHLFGAASLVVVYLAFVPVLAMGQTVFLTVLRRIPLWAGALLLAAEWGVLVFGMGWADPGFGTSHRPASWRTSPWPGLSSSSPCLPRAE